MGEHGSPPFGRATVKSAVARWASDCGERVARRRRVLDLTRAQLADLTGVAEASITRIENGVVNPRDDLRWIIAGVMQVAVDELWPNPSRQLVADLRDVQ